MTSDGLKVFNRTKFQIETGVFECGIGLGIAAEILLSRRAKDCSGEPGPAQRGNPQKKIHFLIA